MKGFSLLWSKILRSSIWIKESKETRLLWITMLAMKDSKGEIHSSFVGLADAAKISRPECKEALKILMSPDDDDTSNVENGIRVKEVPGGWFIVNHDLYRFSSEEKREFWRQQKQEQADKKKRSNGWKPRSGQQQGTDPKERVFDKMERNGATQKQKDDFITSTLPEKCR